MKTQRYINYGNQRNKEFIPIFRISTAKRKIERSNNQFDVVNVVSPVPLPGIIWIKERRIRV